MKVERLSLFNYSELKKMSFKSSDFNDINTNVFKIFKSLTIFDKILIKKNIYLIKDKNLYCGYLWMQCLYKNMYILNDFYFDRSKSDPFKEFCKDKTLMYETMINSDCNKYLDQYNFKISDISDVLKMPLSISVDDVSFKDYDMFETFIKDEHEGIRCELQNSIFESDSRIPITKDDIYYDETQNYYIDDGLIFIKDNENYIGMGQIINLKGKLTIVNFGIRKEYRNNGYAHILLKRLLQKGKSLSQDLNKSYIYIRVSRNNDVAYNIYKNAGFQYDDSVITWER